MRDLGLTEIVLGILIVEEAEQKLGPLSFGQKTDLLLDNMPALEGAAHAHLLVEMVEAERRRQPGEPLVIGGWVTRRAGGR